MPNREPQKTGQYYLLEKIAQGGMAEIYKGLAYDTAGVQKPVCIKKILPQIAASREFIDMLVDEAKIAVRLNHGNIAQIFDLGKAAEDYFIVMEFVDGQTLSKIFKRTVRTTGVLPIDLSLYIAAEIAGGLDHMHRKTDEEGRPLNIIHRDISPQNIMVSYSGTVKIIDFGIAKAAVKVGNTESGTLKGKFAYMSPEQARGDLLDHRSDIFSLGVILHELLTGKRLFKGKNNEATLKNVKKVQVTPPSKLNSSVPKELDRLVMQALEKDRRHRFSFTSELREELLKQLHTLYPDFTAVKAAEYVRQLFAQDIDLSKKLGETAGVTPHLILDKTHTGIAAESEEHTAAGVGGINWREFMLEADWPEEKIGTDQEDDETDLEPSLSDSFSSSHSSEIPESEEETHFPRFELLSWKKVTRFGLAMGVFTFLWFGGLRGWIYWKEHRAIEIPPSPASTEVPATPAGEKLPAPAKILVVSEPAGAEIYLNDESTGFVTPHTFENLVSETQYRLGLFLKNHRFHQSEFKTTGGEIQNFFVQLPIDFGSLSIDSLPKGAQIFIGGELSGTTPLTLDHLPPETVLDIELRLEGHHSFTREIKIFAGKKAVLNAQMEKQ